MRFAQAFAGAAFEQDVIRNNDRGAAVLLQDGEDVLKEVKLFVARAPPGIIAMNDERLFLFVAGFVDDGDAALFSEWRIGQHHFVLAVFPRVRTSPSLARTSRPVAGWLRRSDYLYLAKAREISLALE